MPTARTMMISSAAAAALLLTGCSGQPVKHGEVIDKRGHAGYWIPEYENLYRENCTTVRSSAFTMSLPSGTGGTAGGKSTTSGKTGSSGSTGKTGSSSSSSGGTKPGSKLPGSSGSTTSESSGSATGGTQPTKRCDQELVGRKETGRRWEQPKWELKLSDGDRTGWIKVSQTKYDDTDLHDRI
ncbi:hypothetical protein ACIBEA_38680 [Streptomyces sp. NPDC051555]|uniref:hypothetical protein n=1 Tax=Streptomyces sp. NPDC051555 TaxID=3365657 RepID=UPI0037A2E6A3